MEATLLHMGYSSFFPCTIGKHVQTHSEFSVSSNSFCQLSPLFSGVSAGSIRMRILAFLCIVDSLPWNVFLFGEYVYKYSLYYWSGTHLVRWFWKCIVSGCWDASEIFPCWGKMHFYEGTYSRWKDLGKETEFLASQWATGSRTR